MEAPEIVQRGGIFKRCSTLVPGFGFRQVLGYPTSVLKHRAEIMHGIRITEIGCLFIPVVGSLVILRNTQTAFAQFAETIHGAWKTQLSGFEIPVRSGGEVLGISSSFPHNGWKSVL